MKSIKPNALQETVIENDYCIGCGACEFINPDKYKVEFTEYGMYKARVKDESILTELNAAKVCPFSISSHNEDFISDQLFDKGYSYDHRIGKFLNCYAGHVNEGMFREKGSSGGFGKWLLTELLNSDYVDYVIQVEPNKKQGKLFTYSIFRKHDDLLSGSKSAYYPVTLVDALNFIKNNEGNYAITALPCFSKAIRLLCFEDEKLNSRVKFVLGVICGHLKSTGFAESLAWQLEVEPNKLEEIEFRGKLEGRRANEKGVYAVDTDGNKSKTVSSRSLLGGDWGQGLFKYKACDYCDDIVGETADVSIGDAWLDEYINDYKGSNILITRNKVIDDIIKEGVNNDRLHLDPIIKDKVIESQSGGIRHRREGLSYRLYLKEKSNQWAPKKRVKPTKIRSKKRRKIYTLREKMREKSHRYFLEAKNKNDLELFKRKIGFLISDYRNINRPIKRKISRAFEKIKAFCKKIIKLILTYMGLLDLFTKLVRKLRSI